MANRTRPKRPAWLTKIKVTRGSVTLDNPLMPFMKPAEMAGYLGVSGRKLRRMVEEGSLPAVKIGDAWRFDPLAVRRSLQRREPSRAVPRRESKRPRPAKIP